MLPPYDADAPKKATNLSINRDLLIQAKRLNVNLSAALEQTLAEILKRHQQKQWLEENHEAISAYNQEVEKHGSFGDALRKF